MERPVAPHKGTGFDPKPNVKEWEVLLHDITG